jgi:hypothetical protein
MGAEDLEKVYEAAQTAVKVAMQPHEKTGNRQVVVLIGICCLLVWDISGWHFWRDLTDSRLHKVEVVIGIEPAANQAELNAKKAAKNNSIVVHEP